MYFRPVPRRGALASALPEYPIVFAEVEIGSTKIPFKPLKFNPNFIAVEESPIAAPVPPAELFGNPKVVFVVVACTP